MSSPQVKSNPKSDQTNSTQPILSWETVLRSPRIEKQHIDFALSHISDAPQIPVEFVYSKVSTDVKISNPTSIAISGVGGVIGAILALRYTREVRYFVTTQEVLNANEKSPLFLAKYALELLEKKHSYAQIITIDLGEFEKIKVLLSNGGVYVSGLPYEVVIQVAQLAGFGRLWHFSPIKQRFYVF
jgi:hypothetical protein